MPGGAGCSGFPCRRRYGWHCPNGSTSRYVVRRPDRVDSLLARVVAQRWLRGHVQVAGNRRACGIGRGEPAHRQAVHGVSPSVGRYLRRWGLSARLKTDDKGRLLLALVVLWLSRKRSFDGQSAFSLSGVLSRNRRKFRQPINVACPAPGRWGRPNSRVTSRHFDHGNASRTSRPDCSGLDEAD